MSVAVQLTYAMAKELGAAPVTRSTFSIAAQSASGSSMTP